MKWIIYTDLDGTLLDFDDYSYAVAEERVRRLQNLGIPLVFCSSKTRLEQEVYRTELGMQTPFIVENGSAVLIPKGFFDFDLTSISYSHGIKLGHVGPYDALVLGVPYRKVRQVVESARRVMKTRPLGYADLSLEKIMQLTGLDRAAAKRAARRDFSETLLNGTTPRPEWTKFMQSLEQEGLQCVSGGKFYTVMGAGSDKGRAISLLNKLMGMQYDEIRTAGLGDSANDLPLLGAVDHPYLVMRKDRSWLTTSDERIIKVDGVGPEGWNKAIDKLLSM